MMPLWIRASLPSSPPRCGWALASVGPPWVAQRVCPMPVRGRRAAARASIAASEVGQLAGALAGGDVVAVDEGDAGRVVAAVLQPGQALHHDVERLAVDVRPDVTHDSAHGLQPNGARARATRTPAPWATMTGVPHATGHEPSPRPTSSSTARAWARLRDHHPLSLDRRGRRPGCGASATGSTSHEVEQVYLPLSRLLNFYVGATAGLHRVTSDFLGEQPASAPRSSSASPGRWRSASPRPPGCCASCWPAGPAPPGRAGHHRRLPLPQRRARAPGAAAAQGLPRVLRPPGAAAVRRRGQVRHGRGQAPVYSHLTYDIVPGERVGRAPPRRAHRRGPQRAAAARACSPTAAPGWRSATSSTSRSTSTPASRTSGGGTSTGSCGCARPPSPTPTPTSTATPRSPTTRPAATAEQHLGDDQRAQPHRERPPHPRPRLPGAVQGRGPQRPPGPPPQALSTRRLRRVCPVAPRCPLRDPAAGRG